jgi:hypothetical protein
MRIPFILILFNCTRLVDQYHFYLFYLFFKSSPSSYFSVKLKNALSDQGVKKSQCWARNRYKSHNVEHETGVSYKSHSVEQETGIKATMLGKKQVYVEQETGVKVTYK